MLSVRFFRQAVIFSLMTLLVSAFVQAQPPGGGRGGFGGPGGGRGFSIDRAMLLRIDKVRADLKIEEAQAATIKAALDAYREESNSTPRLDRDAFSKLSEEEQTALREKGQKDREELSKKTDEVLGALLEPEQTKRLEQIAFQMKLNSSLFATLKGDDLKSKLALSDDQIAKLDEAEKAAQTEMQQLFAGGGQGGRGNPGGGGDPAAREAMQKKFADARTRTTESAMAVLSDDQKKQLDEMTGPKLELEMRDLFGGFGGQGGGGRQRGGNGGGTRPPAE